MMMMMIKDHNIHNNMIMWQSQYIHAFIRKTVHSIMLYNGDAVMHNIPYTNVLTVSHISHPTDIPGSEGSVKLSSNTKHCG